ncbi:uncharacterized protein J5F26_013917 [Ciconia maguari]
MEAVARPQGRPAVEDGLRRLRSLLEARQRHLRARIAACEELTAEMAALQAALGAGCRPPCVSPGPGSGSGPGRQREAAPPALPRSPARRAPAPGRELRAWRRGGREALRSLGERPRGPARERLEELVPAGAAVGARRARRLSL